MEYSSSFRSLDNVTVSDDVANLFPDGFITLPKNTLTYGSLHFHQEDDLQHGSWTFIGFMIRHILRCRLGQR